MAEHPAEKLHRAFALQSGVFPPSEHQRKFIREVLSTYYTNPICIKCMTRHTAEHGCLEQDPAIVDYRRQVAREMNWIPSETT